MMHPHAIVPGLEATVAPGAHRLACAVGASDDATAVTLERAPGVPAALLDRLEAFAARELT